MGVMGVHDDDRVSTRQVVYVGRHPCSHVCYVVRVCTYLRPAEHLRSSSYVKVGRYPGGRCPSFCDEGPVLLTIDIITLPAVPSSAFTYLSTTR